MNTPHPEPRDSSLLSPVLIGPALALASFSGMALLFGRTRKSNYRPPIFRSRSKRDKRVRKALQTAQEALETARHQIDLSGAQAAREDMTRRVSTLVETGKANIPPLTHDAAEIARDLAERIRTEGAARGGELTERLKTDVAPAAKIWAQDALAEAEEILSTARTRAGEVTNTARSDYAPAISAKTGAAAGLVAGTAASMAQNLGSRASSISSGRSKRRLSLRKQQPSRASRTLKQAGSSAKSATAETFMIFFWAAALATAIYYAILTPDQRERLRGFLSGAAAQVQDMVADMQSEPDPFAASTGNISRT